MADHLVKTFILSGIISINMMVPAFVFADQPKKNVRAQALAHYITGVVEDLNNRPKSAMAYYQQSLSLNPQEIAPALRLAAYQIRFNNLSAAQEQLEKIIQLRPDILDAKYLLALVYSSQKQFDKAAQIYENLLKEASDQDPKNIEIHGYLAQLYYSQGNIEQTAEQLEQILLLDPDNIAANYLLGSLHMDAHDYKEALKHMRHVLKLQPEHDGALNAMAYLYAVEGIHLDDAKEMIKKAIDIDPTNGAYYDTLGWILYKQGLYAESLMALQKATVYVEDAIVYDHMGDVYAALNEPALARTHWLKAFSLNPKLLGLKEKLQASENVQLDKPLDLPTP